jgi:hypothetical protein
VEGFAALAADAGWRLADHWTAQAPSFAVFLLEA